MAYCIAVAAVGAAVLFRWLLDPVLGDQLPLVTLYGAIAIALWFGGHRPALLAVALGYLACAYLFIPPRFRFAFDAATLMGLTAYLITCSLIIGFGEAMRRAERRADENRRAAEQYAPVIERQREQLRVTVTSIGDAVITTDSEGRVTLLNPVAETLTGWTSADAVGQPLHAVFRIVNEVTRQAVENPVAKVMQTGKVVALANQTVLIAKDGTERPIDDSAAPIRDAKGNITGIVLIFRDISERRQAEQSRWQLAAIVESSEDAIVGKDLDGVITSWNRGAERLYGYAADEVIGKPISLLIPPDHPDELPSIMQRLRRGQRIEQFETTRTRKDGSHVEVSVSISPVRDRTGRIIGASAIARDITDRKRFERELKEADRRKDEFLATLAHELRNPLAPVRNAIQILVFKGPPDPELQAARKVIDRQIGHMARLLDDLFDISRITHNKLELRKERITLATVIHNAVETSRPLIDSNGHQLTVTLPTEPVYLEADAVRLAQVFSNLLNNAAKYTTAGGHIRLAAEQQGGNAVVRVTDDGIGINPEALPHVFEMFSQFTGVSERPASGLGIGLSLVRGLVELHGGRVEARSKGPGTGSEFIVYLPVSGKVAQEPVPRMKDREETPMTTRRILIVDDLRDSADTMAMLLQAVGYEAHTAYDGEQAIVAAAELRPDVVLLDIGMPKLNGYDVCRRIREQQWGKRMFLIALSGWGQENDRRLSEEAGFDHHMLKPASPDALMKVLASVPAEDGIG